VNILPELQERGLVHDTTATEVLGARLAEHSVGVYVGFDPTANSLHVGHLLGQLMLRRMQLAGHRPFPLAGGATGMVGDPSGRSEERNLLDAETLEYNVSCISAQLQRLLDFSPGKFQATLVNNADWTAGVSALDFLRDVGKHITINQMLAKDSVKSRLNSENGLSYTEFSYMLLQANDFRHLAASHDVELQMGGSDQWGNITAGIDLVRKTLGKTAHGLTWPLVTRSDGSKFGKTADGAVWLDAERTSPYQFRQFWVQLGDAEIERYFPQFSLRPIAECRQILQAHAEKPEAREAQRLLARDLTAMVHGDEAAQAAEEVAGILFGGDPTEASPTGCAAIAREVPSSALTSLPADIATLLVDTGVCSSKSEARRNIEQGGVRVNGKQVALDTDPSTLAALHGRYLLLRRGKTAYHMIDLA
jgi:tyrosyl-tRNA synthetase